MTGDGSEAEDAAVSRETRVTYLSGPFAHMSSVYREGAVKAEFEFTASLATPVILVVIILAAGAGIAWASVAAGFIAFFALIGLAVVADFARNLAKRRRAGHG